MIVVVGEILFAGIEFWRKMEWPGFLKWKSSKMTFQNDWWIIKLLFIINPPRFSECGWWFSEASLAECLDGPAALKEEELDGKLQDSFRLITHPKGLDVSKNGGTQQPWVFLLKMIILGCFGGTPIFGNTRFKDFKGWALEKIWRCGIYSFIHLHLEGKNL